jgi:hypothetical protein
VRSIDEVQTKLTDAERASYQECMRIAREEPMEVGKKTFWSSDDGKAAAIKFAEEKGYGQLETRTTAGSKLDAEFKNLADASDYKKGPQRLPWKPDPGETGEGYGSQPWQEVSTRYAQAAEGDAHAFVEGAKQGNVFRTQELPELLRNPKVDEVVFHKDNGDIAGRWTRTGPNGTWEGDPIPNKYGAFDLSDPLYEPSATMPTTRAAPAATPLPASTPPQDQDHP